MIKVFPGFFKGDPTPVEFKKTTKVGAWLKSFDIYSGLGATSTNNGPWGTTSVLVTLVLGLFLFLWILLLICNQTLQVNFITIDWQ